MGKNYLHVTSRTYLLWNISGSQIFLFDVPIFKTYFLEYSWMISLRHTFLLINWLQIIIFFYSECGAALTATSQDQYITSPNYPENYGNNADCSWEISGAAGSIIEFTIVDINLENFFGFFCFDRLELYSHNPPQAEERIIRLCVPPASSIYRTSGSKAIVKFTSDDFNTMIGFNISYKLGI